MNSFWQQLEQLSLKLTPAVLTTFMVLLTTVPFRLPGINEIMPSFLFINIYYWGVFYPGILPYGFLFVLGLLQDTLGGTPLGVCSLVNLVAAFLLTTERRVLGKMLFGSVWFGFAVFLCFATLLQWGVMSIYFAKLLPIRSHLLQYCTTCLAYPLMHIVLTWVYRRIHQL